MFHDKEILAKSSSEKLWRPDSVLCPQTTVRVGDWPNYQRKRTAKDDVLRKSKIFKSGKLLSSWVTLAEAKPGRLAFICTTSWLVRTLFCASEIKESKRGNVPIVKRKRPADRFQRAVSWRKKLTASSLRGTRASRTMPVQACSGTSDSERPTPHAFRYRPRRPNYRAEWFR